MDISSKLPGKISAVFNLRKGEERIVILILIFSFFQYFSVALFFIAANAIFLAEHSVKDLPLILMATALMLYVLGVLFNVLQKVFSARQIILAEVIMLLAITLLLRLGFITQAVGWLGYALIISHRVMADYVEDGFNKLALLLFDVRQGKRLFGIVTSAEIPASILGYLTASTVVPYIGTANLLVISGVTLAISLIFLFMIVYAKNLVVIPDDNDDEAANIPNEQSLVKRFFKTEFIFSLSLTVFCSVVAFSIIEFAFLSRVDAQYKNQVEIVKFIAIIFGIGQVAAFIVKTFLYNFIQRRFGVQVSLFVLPFALAAISVATLFETFFSNSTFLFLWTWVVIMFVNETLRSSLYNTSFLSLLQPLTRKIKIQGFVIINNVELVAIFAGGLLLYVTYDNDADLLEYSYMLLAAVGCWIFVIPQVNKLYLSSLEEVLRKRVVEGGVVEMDNPQTISVLHNKLKSEHAGEVLYALDILSKDNLLQSSEVFHDLLAHPLQEVRRDAYAKIELLRLHDLRDKVKERIMVEEDVEIKKVAIEAYCFLGESSIIDEIIPLLDSPEREIRIGALVGLIKFGGINGIIVAGQRLMECINSPDPEVRAFSAHVIGEVGIKNFYHPLLKLLQDDHPSVRKEALKASGKIRHPELFESMIEGLRSNAGFEAAMHALVRTGEDVLNALIPELYRHEEHPTHFRRIIYVMGRIGGKKATDVLKEKLYYKDVEVRNQILYSCAQCKFVPSRDDKPQIIRIIHAELADAAWFLNCVEVLSGALRWIKESDIALVVSAVHIELYHIKRRILFLLSFLYNSREILQIWESIQMKNRERTANAIEIVDVLAPKELSSLILPLLEDFPIQQQIRILNAKYNAPKLTLDKYLQTLLTGEDSPSVIPWTRATAAFAIRQVKMAHLRDELEKVTESKNIILAETASYTLRQIELADEGENEPVQTGPRPLIVKKSYVVMEQKLLTIEKVMALKTTEIFRETSEDILVDIAHILKEISFRKDEVIVRKNEIGTCMFIIFSGSVKIHDGDINFATLRRPDFFGELSLLDTEPRSASVTALEESVLLRIDQQAFYEIMGDRREVIREIMKILCRRLRKQNQEVSRLNEKLAKRAVNGAK